MNVLVTAGNTQVPIDRVRCLTNVFTGRTGAEVALSAHERGHSVTLLTSHPEVVTQLHGGPLASERWAVLPYRTFDELHHLMRGAVQPGGLDAVIHSAAVSDYLAGGIYAPAPHTRFDPGSGRWEGDPPALLDRAAGKVKSDEPELWLRLVRAPKLIDRVRPDWGFRGVLVKFKLEVGVEDARLLEIAERSRRHSSADLMVANTLEGAGAYAYLGPVDGHYQRVERRDLAARVVDVTERLLAERRDG
ncbi:MAG TPA: phosphopantothenoylcysteine decarboxylase [Gemmataceae bacterium]|nr:phosphopantothenoylcysteine decarboxylase [Gemmataceae bacterium]